MRELVNEEASSHFYPGQSPKSHKGKASRNFTCAAVCLRNSLHKLYWPSYSHIKISCLPSYLPNRKKSSLLLVPVKHKLRISYIDLLCISLPQCVPKQMPRFIRPCEFQPYITQSFFPFSQCWGVLTPESSGGRWGGGERKCHNEFNRRGVWLCCHVDNPVLTSLLNHLPQHKSIRESGSRDTLTFWRWGVNKRTERKQAREGRDHTLSEYSLKHCVCHNDSIISVWFLQENKRWISKPSPTAGSLPWVLLPSLFQLLLIYFVTLTF